MDSNRTFAIAANFVNSYNQETVLNEVYDDVPDEDQDLEAFLAN